MTVCLSPQIIPRVWSFPNICIARLTPRVIKKCSHDKWQETSFAVEVQKDHDILESSSCPLPRRPAHISGFGWHLTRGGSALTHSRRGKKKKRRRLEVVSWDHRVYSSLLEDNYSLIQFMTQNAPNPLTNASFPPPSTFRRCWPNKWWLFLPRWWQGC